MTLRNKQRSLIEDSQNTHYEKRYDTLDLTKLKTSTQQKMSLIKCKGKPQTEIKEYVCINGKYVLYKTKDFCPE